MKTFLEYESLEEYAKDYPHASSWSQSDWEIVRESRLNPRYYVDISCNEFSEEAIRLFMEEMFGSLK